MAPFKLPKFAPDLSEYNPAYTDVCVNLEPKADGYGPLAAFATTGTGLGSSPRGAITVTKADGSSDLYAGTATALRKFNISTGAWDDVTRLSGGAYALPEGYNWSFTQIEDINGSRLIATNGFDANQYIDVNVGTNFDALPGSPIASFCTNAGGFLVLARLSTDNMAVAWSGFRDTTKWDYGYYGSDIQPIPDGGDIQGILGREGDAILFQSLKIRRMELVYSDTVFRIRVIHEGIGCFAPGSIVGVRNTFFWYDQGGFYEGIEATPIGDERVNEYVRRISDDDNLKFMQAAINPVSKLVWWLIPTTTTSFFMIGYDWILSDWTSCDEDIAYLFSAVAPGYTIDSLWTLLGYTMDTIPYTFDAAFWSGSEIQLLGGFTSDGDFGYFQAAPLAARLETAHLEFNPGGFGYLRSVGAVIDTDRSNVTVTTGTKEIIGGATTWHTSQPLDAFSGYAFPCKEARTHRIRIDIASSAWDNFKSLEFNHQRSGNFG
jgi:hypothetical protein